MTINKVVYIKFKKLKEGEIATTSDGKHYFKVVKDLGDGAYSVEWLDEYEPSKTNSSKKKIKN